MALNRSQVNPLSVLGQRKLSFIPEHFSRISVNKTVDAKLLDHWINYNLNSRYCIKRSLVVESQNGKLIEQLEIGLEDPKELVMLTLGCTLIHGKKD
jgi:hypothetical protein